MSFSILYQLPTITPGGRWPNIVGVYFSTNVFIFRNVGQARLQSPGRNDRDGGRF